MVHAGRCRQRGLANPIGWCIPFLILLSLIAPHLARAQSAATLIELVYNQEASLRKASLTWPAFLETDKAVDYDGLSFVHQQDAGLPVDAWDLSLAVDWATGTVGGSMSGTASLGDPVSQLYMSCWPSHAGECSGSAQFSGKIVEGHVEPHGDRGQWRICFVVEGQVHLDYQMSHFVRPWQEGLVDDGSPSEPNERVSVARESRADIRQFFTGIIYPPDGDRRSTPVLQLLTKDLATENDEETRDGPFLNGMGPQFAFVRGDLPQDVPAPGPAAGVCEAAEATGTIGSSLEGTSEEPTGVEEPLGDLSASIGIFPDPPVLDKAVVFRSEVQGSGPSEGLRYAWQLDGEPLGTDESAQWTASLGEHVVTLHVESAEDPERTATASIGFVVTQPPPTEDQDTAKDASFAMGSLNCREGISSDDTLTCTASWNRNEESGLGALVVQWYVDGVPASQENSVGQNATFSLAEPAPGEHSIQVRLIDPASDAQAARTTTVQVAPGSNARIPVSARAAAAVGSAGTVAGWLWIEWRRARQAAILAEQRSQAQEAAEAALAKDRQAWYEAQMRQNDIERQQRQQHEAAAALRDAENAFARSASRSHQLAREAADLTRHLQKLRADYDYTRYTAVSDGVIDIVDLTIDMGLSASGQAPGWLQTPAGAGAKDWVKGLAKGAARQKLGEMVDGRPSDYKPLDEALSAAGLPPDYARAPMDTASKRSWDRIGYDLAPRGAIKQAYSKRLQGVPSAPLQRIGDAVGPIESVVTGVHDAASKADQAARLRQRIVVTDQQLRRRNRLFADALEDLVNKRSAVQRARDANRIAKG